MELVSVIIPVYNEFGVLPRCLDSMLGQTHSELEIILVDNGSTDGSADVCDAYAARDGRVRALHIPRSNAYVARNAGMAVASGEYLQFIDADDYVKPELTAVLLDAIRREKTDLSVCGATDLFVRDDFIVSQSPGVALPPGRMRGLDFLRLFTRSRDHSRIVVLWNKLYLRRVIEQHHIAFREDVTSGGDALFNIQYLKRCGDVFVIPEPYYIYVHGLTADSATCENRYFPHLLEYRLIVCRDLVEALEPSSDSRELRILHNALANVMIAGIVKYCRSDAVFTRQEIVRRLSALSREPDVLQWLADYRPRPGQSRLLPFFLKHGWMRLLFRLARYKADKNYSAFYQNRQNAR